MRRTRDGFITDVPVGSVFPLSEMARLVSDGFDFERVNIVVAEDEMGNLRMRRV